MRLSSFALCLLGLALAAPLAAAQSDEVRRVILVDGTVIIGTIADESADPLVVLSRDGLERRIPRDRVAEITGLVAGRFSRLDPTRSRLLLTPTARTIGAGSTRLSLLSYIVPNVAYGVTDRVDISATGFLTFGSGGGGVLPVLGVKGTIVQQPGVSVALGLSGAIQIGGEFDDNAFVGVPYGVVTVGSEVASVNFAVGGAFGGSLGQDQVELAEGVILSVGGERQLTNSLKFLGEAIVPIGEGTTAAAGLAGLRFFGDRFSIDVYGVVVGYRDEFTVIDNNGNPVSTQSDVEIGGFAPFLSATYRF